MNTSKLLDNLLPIPDLTEKQELRFYRKILHIPGGCHIWIGHYSDTGHGKFDIKDKIYIASRIAWKLATGNDPGKNLVLHKCLPTPNPQCVNPSHLYLGTSRQNTLDKFRDG